MAEETHHAFASLCVPIQAISGPLSKREERFSFRLIELRRIRRKDGYTRKPDMCGRVNAPQAHETRQSLVSGSYLYNRGSITMGDNRHLQAAKNAKDDEYYTTFETIAEELRHYVRHFRDKTVLCNCDDPYESNFCVSTEIQKARAGCGCVARPRCRQPQDSFAACL